LQIHYFKSQLYYILLLFCSQHRMSEILQIHNFKAQLYYILLNSYDSMLRNIIIVTIMIVIINISVECR
jgi:hypothetical protein